MNKLSDICHAQSGGSFRRPCRALSRVRLKRSACTALKFWTLYRRIQEQKRNVAPRIGRERPCRAGRALGLEKLTFVINRVFGSGFAKEISMLALRNAKLLYKRNKKSKPQTKSDACPLQVQPSSSIPSTRQLLLSPTIVSQHRHWKPICYSSPSPQACNKPR